ncbi:RCC1 domain-containing protein 1 [Caerostris darwini]|uniref:RCC1 domain-containing protein 1 n=1 Tax=Caerostris darwini TaxID=1538125 RepID=A0AAV4RJB0_9ARAC|nr:RCC1 domain-containing protein 1 [Caerostris darwini]
MIKAVLVLRKINNSHWSVPHCSSSKVNRHPKMNKLFLYFGGDIFKNYHDVFLPTLNIDQDFNIQIISHLNVPSKPEIKDIYLGLLNLLLKTDGEVYHIGYNQSIREVFSSLKDSHIVDISYGFDFSYLITKAEKCYVSSNKDFKPELLVFLPADCKIKSIVTEDLYTIALTEDGKVFRLQILKEPFIEKLLLPIPIKEIACGKEHVLLLSNSGTVFSYGSGSKGQLGHGSIENHKTPELIEALEGLQIKSVSAGGWHSAAISDSGDLYMWGWNESGQLGMPCNELQGNKRPMEEIETVCCLPKIVELEEENVKSVCCGCRHTVALTEKNHVWTWGWNEYGQLGHKNVKLTDAPEKIQLPNSLHPLDVKAKFWSTLIIGSMLEKE